VEVLHLRVFRFASSPPRLTKLLMAEYADGGVAFVKSRRNDQPDAIVVFEPLGPVYVSPVQSASGTSIAYTSPMQPLRPACTVVYNKEAHYGRRSL